MRRGSPSVESLKDLARGCAGVMDIDDSFKGESSQIEAVRKEVMAESLGVRKLGSSLTDKGCQWRNGSETENRVQYSGKETASTSTPQRPCKNSPLGSNIPPTLYCGKGPGLSFLCVTRSIAGDTLQRSRPSVCDHFPRFVLQINRFLFPNASQDLGQVWVQLSQWSACHTSIRI